MVYKNGEDDDLKMNTDIDENTYRLPTLTKANFTVKPQSATRTIVEVKNLDLPNNERLSYQPWGKTSVTDYIQLGNGVRNATITFDKMAKNTKQDLTFGLVAANTTSPFVVPPLIISVYPKYEEMTNKTRIRAELDPNNFSNINVSWEAWNDWGNLVGWSAEVHVFDVNNNKMIARKGVNVKTNGKTVVKNKSLTDNLRVRIAAKGVYHDGTGKTVLSNDVFLLSQNNTFVKSGSVWRKGVQTFVKADGIWKINKGAVQINVNGVWK